MKRNGFTLIELLATIIILSLIMVVAVPNIMSTIDNNKKRTYVEDAKKMITLAEYRIRSDPSINMPPQNNDCIIVTLSSLDLTEFDEGPEGGDYDFSNSYALVLNSGSTYQYYASLTEIYGSGKRRGIDKQKREILNQENALNNVKDFSTVTAISKSLENHPFNYNGSQTCTVKYVINYQK